MNYYQINYERKRKRKQHVATSNLNESSHKRRPRKRYFYDEYSFYSSLTCSIAGHDEIWLVDSGASSHMTGSFKNLSKLVQKKTAQRVELGDNGKYEFKGIGSPSFQLESGGNVSIKNIFYVPGLKKNLLSISSFEDEGYRIAFVDGKVPVWKKDALFESLKVIGVRIGYLYHLLGHSIQSLIHNTYDICKLWHQMYAQVHYKTLYRMKDFVKGVPEITIELDGVCKGCVLGKNV